jgi:hypothetical protein
MTRPYASMVKAYPKSIVLGGGDVLYPVVEGRIEQQAEIIRKVIRRAEEAAYERGREDALRGVRKAMGVPE